MRRSPSVAAPPASRSAAAWSGSPTAAPTASPGSIRRPTPSSALPIAVGERPGGIDAGTESVWVANSADDTVSRIEIESGETEGDPISVGPDPGAIAVGSEAVWVANNGDGTVTRIEP